MSTSRESSPTMPSTVEDAREAPLKPLASQGLHLQVVFLWTRFRNDIAARSADGSLTPLYVVHCHPSKPQLRYERIADKTIIGKGSVNAFSISSDCIIHGQQVILQPLKRWQTHYNYLSRALGGVPVSWIASMILSHWDFVCVNSATQEPIAKFSTNWWTFKEVGNFYFTQAAHDVHERLRDEVVVTGLTLLYVMRTRMNNPIHLLGAVFAKPGRVEG